jgi:hypothetical protein
MNTQRSGGALLAGYLSENELAKELRRDPATLARWRKRRIGPPFVMNGRLPFYNIEAARAWLAAGGTNAAAPATKQRRRKG